MKRTLLALACLPLLLALAACRSEQPVPRYANIGFDEGALDGWAQVLREYVDESGRVDYDALRARPQPLERYVTWLAHNGPELSPNRMQTREEKLAFYLNAYNALAMYNVLVSGWEPDQGWRFFKRSRMRLDGRYVCLAWIEDECLRPLGDERAYLAMNGMQKGAPRLRRQPFRADLVDDQLERTAVELFNDPGFVRYDGERGRVRVNRVLTAHRKAFLREADSLVAYANRYRANPLPEDAKVSAMPFDDSLNER